MMNGFGMPIAFRCSWFRKFNAAIPCCRWWKEYDSVETVHLFEIASVSSLSLCRRHQRVVGLAQRQENLHFLQRYRVKDDDSDINFKVTSRSFPK